MELNSISDIGKFDFRHEFKHVSPLYCDYNATSPLPELVIASLTEAYSENWFNLSAQYDSAAFQNKWLAEMKMRLSSMSGSNTCKVILGSSATEMINQAIYSLSLEHDYIIISDSEHSAVKASANLWFEGKVGFFSTRKILSGTFDDLIYVTTKYPNACIFLQGANNETGVVLPVAAIRAALPNMKIVMDASQIFGKESSFLDIFEVADGIVVSPHKFYGPKGLGILLWKSGAGGLAPLLVGGGQQRGFRGGTENTPNLLLMKKWLAAFPMLVSNFDRVFQFKLEFEKTLVELFPKSFIVGSQFHRLANTSAICFPGVISHSLVAALNSRNIMASSGSACNAGTQEPSASYLAMDLSWDDARCVTRFSFGFANCNLSPRNLAGMIADAVSKFGR